METGTGDTDPERTALPPEVIEDLLADDRCRALLARLAAADGPVLVEDLAADVLASEHGQSAEKIPAGDRRQAMADLFERQLPLLTATRVVEYDSRLDAVELIDDEVAARLD